MLVLLASKLPPLSSDDPAGESLCCGVLAGGGGMLVASMFVAIVGLARASPLSDPLAAAGGLGTLLGHMVVF